MSEQTRAIIRAIYQMIARQTWCNFATLEDFATTLGVSKPDFLKFVLGLAEVGAVTVHGAGPSALVTVSQARGEELGLHEQTPHSG